MLVLIFGLLTAQGMDGPCRLGEIWRALTQQYGLGRQRAVYQTSRALQVASGGMPFCFAAENASR